MCTISLIFVKSIFQMFILVKKRVFLKHFRCPTGGAGEVFAGTGGGWEQFLPMVQTRNMYFTAL